MRQRHLGYRESEWAGTRSVDEEAKATDSVDRLLAVTRMFVQHRPQLLKMVEQRMHPLLRGRLDPTDILQEAFLEMSERIEQFYAQQEVPFHIWAHAITKQKLSQAHRKHLDAKKRNAVLEMRSLAPTNGDKSSILITTRLAHDGKTPSQTVILRDQIGGLMNAMSELSEADRTVIKMRHFQHLSNEEVASSLGLSKTAASNRYVRALCRLRSLLQAKGLVQG